MFAWWIGRSSHTCPRTHRSQAWHLRPTKNHGKRLSRDMLFATSRFAGGRDHQLGDVKPTDVCGMESIGSGFFLKVLRFACRLVSRNCALAR